MSDHYKDNFLRSAVDWICDGYAITIRYIVFKDGVGKPWLADAAISVNPLPHLRDNCFCIHQVGISVGQVQLDGLTKSDVLEVLDRATRGQIKVHGEQYDLNIVSKLDYFSEMALDERAFADLHLQVIGSPQSTLSHMDFVAMDNQLRRSIPPFDGLGDVVNWFGFNTPRTSHAQPSIKIRVSPPVDLFQENCSLENDELTLVLHAHPDLAIDRLRLAIRAVPGDGLASRKQIGSQISWGPSKAGRKEGTVKLCVEQADNVLAMLLLGSETVRRHWFIDPVKARNSRLVATRSFDTDLRRLNKVIFDGTDSREFEKGIASLAFLLGCAPALQVESNAPDLILATPRGRLVVVECTQRTADFSAKLGKLVDRRRGLERSFESNQHHAQIYSLLICGLPRDQIHHDAQALGRHKIALVTREDLESAFATLRHPVDPDITFDKLDSRFALSQEETYSQLG